MILSSTLVLALMSLNSSLANSTPESASPSTALATLENALESARAGSTYVLVDTFTTWCGPCRQFHADYDSLAAIRDALSSVVYVAIDVGDSSSTPFNERYPVGSVPQFILLDPDGGEHGRLYGYGDCESFLERLGKLLADPTPVAEGLALLEADSTWEGPAEIAKYYSRRNEYEKAATYHRAALARGATSEQRLQLLWAYLIGLDAGWSELEDAIREAEQAAAQPDTTERYWYRLYTLMGQLAEKAQNDSLRHPYLERAAEEARTLGDWERNPDLRFDYAHYVLGDHELAARERRAIVEQRPSPYTINIYAGYCFEHRVDLDAAEELAREGIEMEGSPQTIAMLTDTLAELVNLHGETEEALGLIERCIELDPDNEHFRNQERRFREVLAQGAESP